jgi:hypothetical protein
MSKRKERSPKFFFLKIDGETYNQKFPSYERAHDFFITVHNSMMIEKQLVNKIELLSSSNKILNTIEK